MRDFAAAAVIMKKYGIPFALIQVRKNLEAHGVMILLRYSASYLQLGRPPPRHRHFTACPSDPPTPGSLAAGL